MFNACNNKPDVVSQIIFDGITITSSANELHLGNVIGPAASKEALSRGISEFYVIHKIFVGGLIPDMV